MLMKRIGGNANTPAEPEVVNPNIPAPPPPGFASGGDPQMSIRPNVSAPPPPNFGQIGAESQRVITSAPPPLNTNAMPGVGLPSVVVERDKLREFRNQIISRMQASIGPETILTRNRDTIQQLASRFKALTAQLQITLPDEQLRLLFDEVLAEMVGFGPLEPLLGDDAISEVMVNGPNQIYIERKGKLTLSDVKFENDDHVMRVVNRIVAPLSRRVDRKSPMVDARLPDGSRVNVIIPPCALNGPTITIRKFSKKPLSSQDLIRFGSVSEDMMRFLEACVHARLNMVVSGGTGSGKTTLLNVLSSFIPSDERIVTIEDSAELQLLQDHVVTLEAKPAEIDGTGVVTIRDLVKNSLRMRPERIVIGECRGGEALDMLQAMNTGHDGSLTTLHANNPRDTIKRMETLVLMSGMDLPLKVVREQIASAIEVIVQQARLRDGSRKITHITEVQGMEGDQVVLQDIFVFEETGTDQNGKIIGRLKPTGLRPKFYEKLVLAGFALPPSVFGAPVPQQRGR